MDQERKGNADPRPAPARHPASGCATTCLVLAVLAAIPLAGYMALLLAIAAGWFPMD